MSDLFSEQQAEEQVALTGTTPIEEHPDYEPDPEKVRVRDGQRFPTPPEGKGVVYIEPPVVVSKAALEAALLANKTAAIRSFTIAGPEKEKAGVPYCKVHAVYVWDAAAPAGEFQPRQITPQAVQKIKDLVLANEAI